MYGYNLFKMKRVNLCAATVFEPDEIDIQSKENLDFLKYQE